MTLAATKKKKMINFASLSFAGWVGVLMVVVVGCRWLGVNGGLCCVCRIQGRKLASISFEEQNRRKKRKKQKCVK